MASNFNIAEKHFQAHHLFYLKKFNEASQVYCDLLAVVPADSQLRREVADGSTRSLLKAGRTAEALEAANELVIISN